jgi:L-ascorbate metabolism protein UlaG (beta-lactamase superfamily)
MSDFQITHIGGPTALIEVGGLRILTDPTFDPPGQKYKFGVGIGSQKLAGPAIGPDAIGEIDLVLLSHDHHDDNFDPTARAWLPNAKRAITTPSGGKRLGGNAEGLAPWSSVSEGDVRVTATPARHGPPGSKPVVGEVVGFVLEWPGQEHGALWITGDTVWFGGVAEVGKRFKVGTAIVHLGGVRFPLTGPARYTMNAGEAVRVAREFHPTTLIPIHYEGWKHFVEGRDKVERAFAEAGLGDQVRWLTIGEPSTVSA